ncbi:MAG: CPBP family intramembrane metalloprotease [Bacteroidales bacterium]|nr:CPBP family intramembrane metalloprotease [Bacteroidales bacterium]
MHRIEKNYNIFDGYAFYAPGVGGMFALLGWLFVGMLLGIVVETVMQFFSPEFALRYGMLITYPLQFMPPMIWASSKSRQNALSSAPMPLNQSNFGNYNGWLLGGLALVGMVALSFIIDIISYGIYRLTLMSELMTSFYNLIMNLMKDLTGGPLWASLLSVSIMAPLFEEWLCRGEILRGLLRRGMRPFWAIIISALFFAVIHGNPWQAVPALLIGCLMGYIYYKTGSLWLTMLIHFVNNTIAVIISNIDSLKDIEYWYNVIPAGPYWTYFAASAVILAAVILVFSRIPNLPTSTSSNAEGTNP